MKESQLFKNIIIYPIILLLIDMLNNPIIDKKERKEIEKLIKRNAKMLCDKEMEIEILKHTKRKID